MTTYNPITKIELKDLAELKRVGSSTDDTSTLYYYKLGKKLGFVNASGEAVSSASSVTIWYYRVPISGEEISSTVEPIVDTRWDNALCYGACFDLTGDEKWLRLFQIELDRMRSLELAQVDRGMIIPSNEEYN